MSKKEMERMTRRFIGEISPIIGPDSDICAPGDGLDCRYLQCLQRAHLPSIVTAKLIEIASSLGRLKATSRGILFVLREVAKLLNFDLSRSKVVIQGFGNVGYHVAELIEEFGTRVIAVSDVDGAILNENGLDPANVLGHSQKTGSVAHCPESMNITNAELLELPCDILISAAIEGQIARSNAGNIRAKIIIEGANGPTSPFADEILDDKGVYVIPDILANAGGVTVSYFE
jgi:glutamate dehydrogenase/leucine dehydrogenase